MRDKKSSGKAARTVLRGVMRCAYDFIDVLFTRIRPAERGCCACSNGREAQVPRGILRDIPKELYSLYRRKIHSTPSYEPGPV